MDNLGFEPIEVDADLAEKYLTAHNNFEDWPQSGMFWHIKKYPNDKDVYNQLTIRKSYLTDHISGSLTPANLGQLLARKIEENELLFTQLEYLIRKTDAVDVKYNIKMISEHVQCCDPSAFNTGCPNAKIDIVMDEKTPLGELGRVPNSLLWFNDINIITNQKMAPLCYLFCSLCAELGWEIPLIFAHDTEEYKRCLDNLSEPTAIFRSMENVTESDEVDPEMDFFSDPLVSNPPNEVPWEEQRIHVQQNTYNEVQEAILRKRKPKQVKSCSCFGKAFAKEWELF